MWVMLGILGDGVDGGRVVPEEWHPSQPVRAAARGLLDSSGQPGVQWRSDGLRVPVCSVEQWDYV